MTAAWEAYLRARFPGYLLPEASLGALPVDAAERFLARLGGRPDQLFLVRAASVAAAHVEEICDLAGRLVSITATAPDPALRVSPGELRGRLDVPATAARWARGRWPEIAARAPRWAAPPEGLLLKATALRLAGVIGALGGAGLMRGWAAPLPSCARALRRALTLPPLRDLPCVPVGPEHERAAGAVRSPCHALALRLHRALREGLDARDPAVIARVVAAGALSPLADHTRFELAVMIRLIEAIEGRLSPRGFALDRAAVTAGRREIALFTGPRGETVRVYYDQAPLSPGPCHAGLSRYLDQRGRLRPDITVVRGAPGRADRAAVIEAKLSEDPVYLAQGFREAWLYRAEYQGSLGGWPEAILVTSARVGAAPRRGDGVIAVGWEEWVPEVVLEGLVG